MRRKRIKNGGTEKRRSTRGMEASPRGHGRPGFGSLEKTESAQVFVVFLCCSIPPCLTVSLPDSSFPRVEVLEGAEETDSKRRNGETEIYKGEWKPRQRPWTSRVWKRGESRSAKVFFVFSVAPFLRCMTVLSGLFVPWVEVTEGAEETDLKRRNGETENVQRGMEASPEVMDVPGLEAWRKQVGSGFLRFSPWLRSSVV